MTPVRVSAHIDENHRLVAVVPDSLPPGPVSVLIVSNLDEDDAGHTWMQGIAQEWADEIADVRQDIYTLEDGEPVGAG